jgi:hypothetical protein
MTEPSNNDHGIEIVVGDGVDFIDTRAEGQPTVHFSRAEFEAFAEGVRAGEFDLDAGGEE